ncbi:E3 ubiquitin-protein ligase RNF213 isoform X3 [Chelonia mydas]|uniref:E3 ubiquitin-protein ligase RNF213 isoform X3 n=1 Tax=Chelonia mydas TaxID=8469 RepID=UPI001CA9F56E|nr:E3 ubiquitin-protein ligase RNF213 isoform X3 [Chelonia mydas]
MKCPKCDYISQDASPNFCSSCGFRLVPHISTQSMEKVVGSGDVKPAPVPEGEVESGRELKVEGAFTVPAVDRRPLTRETQGKPGELLSQSLGTQSGVSKKKTAKVASGVVWSELDDANSLSRKRRKEKPIQLEMGCYPHTSPQQKKRKRNKNKKNPSDSGLQDSLTSISSAPCSLDSSLSSELAGAKNPAQESQIQEHEVAKAEADSSPCNNESQIKSDRSLCPLGNEGQSPETIVEDNPCSSDTMHQSVQNGTNDELAQPAGSRATEKMEDESSPSDGQMGRENKESAKKENESSPAEVGQPSGNRSDTQTSGGDRDALASKEEGESVSLGLCSTMEAPVRKDSNSDADHQSQEKKVSFSEAETAQSRKVEQERKQQASAPVSKNMEGEAKGAPRKGTPEEMEKKTNQTKATQAPKKDYASAVTGNKDKKQQKNQEANENRIKPSQVNHGEGVTVCFHAILSKDFKLDPNQHKVFIRAQGISGYLNWKDNICELTCAKDLGEHGLLIEGCVTISKDNMNKPLPYKYFISRSKNGEYEFIYKPCPERVDVNRCLIIRSKYLSSGDWHQYDDIVCTKPPDTLMRRFKNWAGWDDWKKNVERGKQIAAEIMLETIFSILTTWTNINMKNFLNQLHQFYIVTQKPMVYEGEPKEWASLEFGEKQVKELLVDCLRKVAQPFLDRNSANAPPKDVTVKSRLGLGLISVVLGECYELPTNKEDLSRVCSLLCLEQKPQEILLQEMNHNKAVFSVVSYMKPYLSRLCQRCIDEQVDQWVCILPVLHFFTSSSDFDEGMMVDSHLKSEEIWAGLEGLLFIEFRKKQEESYKNRALLQLMKGKKHLMEVDRTLVRSWISLLPLEDLAEFLTVLSVELLDCLLGIYHRLQNTKITLRSSETIEKLLETLLHVLDRNQHRMLQVNSWKSCLHICLKLHQMICLRTKELKYYKLPATNAEIISRISRLEPLDGSRDETMQKIPVVEVLQRALSATKSWFREVLKQYLLQGHTDSFVTFRFPDELTVWNQFVRISFPDECFTEEWKKTLLSVLEGRIKQERPVRQIAAYCHHHDKFETLDHSVGKSFENCAMEAVNAACQSEGNLLDLVSSYNLDKFGKLVSAVITKSWPSSKSGEPMDDFDEVLHHLLVWSDIKHIFNFNGADGKILEQLTDAAKKLTAVAGSVFTNVAENLLNGSILVKRLELIIKHQKQFICIWELQHKHLSSQEKKQQQNDLEKVLVWRREEIISLKRERNWVGTLLDMCRKVQAFIKVDIVEVEEKYHENLDTKELSEVVDVRELNFPMEGTQETYYNLSPELKKVAEMMHRYKDSHIFQLCWERAAQMMVEEYEESEGQIIPILNLHDKLFSPCYHEYKRLYNELQSGKLTFAEVDTIFNDFTSHYEQISTELQIMCKLDPVDNRAWIGQRLQQIQQYHELHLAFDSAKVIAKVKEGLNLSGDFRILQMLLNFTDSFESFKKEKLDSISSALMRAKERLQGITEPRRRCLEELALRKDFINWVKEALEDINELKVFVDLASISAGENDMDVDRVACFHDAVLGYSSLLYELKRESGFEEFMQCLKKLWKALESDENLPKKLCDSARHLEWLKTVKESHGSVELSSLSLATTINSKGIYIIRAPPEGQKVSLDTVLFLSLPESHGDSEEMRQYSLEELRELLNKLMLMSGKGDQGMEVEKFSEVFSNVQRLALSFIDLYSAGNMLFRSWIASVYCSPTSEVCISMDFCLKLVGQLFGKGDMMAMLLDLCREMEKFLEKWKCFMSEKRSQYFYLNYYTSEQLVYLCRQLGTRQPSENALMMLSFIKHNCTRQDVRMASKHVVSERSRKNISDLRELLCSERDLTEQLQQVWGLYIADMSSFLPGCWDINTLGSCLASLADLEKESVTRVLPRGLHVGRPNLVICPRSDVLTSALAIYMHSPCQALPTYAEVLLCTPETDFEQVGLFLRRCLTPGCKGKKIYTMLYADELSYDVSYRLEKLFQNLCRQLHQDNYCLVILCDCEREHSYIPSVFSQYKVHMIPQKPLRDIQMYLRNHYKVMQPAGSAASVFNDNMCVGIVSSKRAGVGKSLYVKRLHEKLKTKLHDSSVPLKTIRLIEPHVDESKVLRSLLSFLHLQYQQKPMIFHFDITSSVQSGIPEFLFKLLVLQYLTDTDGKMWLRQQCHLYIVEILDVPPAPKKPARFISHGQKYNFLDVFPKITCKSPKEVLDMDVQGGPSEYSTEPGMDQKEFCSEAFQRPFQYLKRFDRGDNLDMFCYEEGSVEGTPAECLQLFLIHCGVIDPTWSELRNFAWFLNVQLRDCEASVFCNPAFVQDTLQGFKNFVVTFMILMARDFATPTLNISDQSPGRQVFDMKGVTEEDLIPFRIRKKWESEPHPYIFFNEDRVSMTFIGFHLQANNNGGIDAINPMSGNIIKKDVMTVQLYKGLVLQRVPFNINFDQLPRDEKLEKLCLVLGIQWAMDPDETYELTTDNILKIFAIEMRFRCGIPVIIMGETGCGKTRLIKFLCELRRSGVDAENMKLVKVHGGTSAEMIHAKIREAEDIAVSNKRQHQFDTILFFDEANTTQAVGSIKEVLCDRTVEGQPLVSGSGLQIIAACNPYRKHAEKMIQRLESAGLGYRVKADKTKDKLGSIPLRQLVYRVHALPPSMIPLVWDFGQLNDITEKIYIQQIVQRLTESIQISAAEIGVVTDVLFASQRYMRGRNDECSFVSLRDVERCVEVFKWFYSHSELLLNNLEQYLAEKGSDKCKLKRNRVIWSLILAVGVCYHASLEKKELYRSVICKYLPKPYDNQKGILEEISLMQDLFLSGVPLRNTIARNLALKENVFMMVICIELKIPLFLVGKPGSSKSLAKTIVADAMQGQAAYSDLYKEMKQIHLVSFQCSPHSTPEGIIGTFKQCARFQDGKNLKEYVSVVVLDEIGLAEDSPKMPLKTLHPLLEDGCIDDVPLPHKKVGFIGISNWALDPAKMNRGIFVSRGDPSNKELIESAKGICSSERIILQRIECYFPIFADAYEKICKTQDREFFGLRDYYSLIKMILALTKASKREPTPCDIAQVVLRNFSGKDDINALDIFTSRIPKEGEIHADDVSTIDLVRQNIRSNSQDGECRYLLVLTENYAALQILQQAFFAERQQPEIIFGSSFPKDQEYTQICRNINRVKICMETGQMVVLLNLQNLYESLYDALNQYYVYLAGQKYVDLGLGTHRVKCRVHPKFRLIVIEEKEVVYKRFPIPLINRLEKHYLDINTVLDKRQRDIVEELMKWVNDFIAFDTEKHLMGRQEYSPSDVFIGYHSDTCASVVLQVTEKLKQRCRPDELMPNVQQEAQLVLLNCATPDSVVRLGSSRLSSCVADHLANKYFKEQQHTSLVDFLQTHIHAESRHRTVFTEITTFSRLLTATDSERLKAEVQGKVQSLSIRSWSLQQFDTEHSFLKEIRNFLDSTSENKILIIQTDFEDGSQSAQLIASAKYSAVNEINKVELGEISVFVYFITKLSRIEGGTSYVGFHGGLWQSVHIDDLRRSKDMVSDVTALRNLTISQLFCEDVDKPEPMIVDGEEQEEEMEVETATSEAEECVTQVLDTTTLLRSCVQSAVGMLRDQSEGSCRSTKRIEILLGFLSKEDDLKASFLKIVKNRLFSLLKKQEENPFNLKDWVLREAANLNALQEAGTFRHTLWKRVQNVVTPFLAHMVSITDRDCNLELLVRPNTEGCVKHLWMFIFSDLNLLSIPYNVGNSSSQTETILVQNDMKVPAQAGNEMPFSWRIKDYLEELWLQAQYIPGTEGHTEKFVGIFQKTPLGEFISSLGEAERNMLFHCYVRDFILLTIGLSSSQELQFLQIALLSCIEELKAASVGGEEKMLSLPWVHLGYHQFRSRLQNFSRILAVNPSVLNSLLYQAEKGSTSSPYEMVLDVFAAMACAEMLEDQVLKSRPQIWLQQVKNLHMPIELVCMESCSKDSGSQCHQLLQEVKLRWNRVFSMSLFVEHMLLGTESLIPELQDLVKRHILLLGNCLQWDSDVKTHKTFTAVMKVLYQCKEEANATICKYGLKPCPICLEDPKDPVNLPCDHVFCQSCIKQWLTPGQMFCPYCKVNLPDDYSVTISQELSVAIKRNAQFRQMCNSFFIDLVSTMCFKDNEPPEKAVIQELLRLLFVHREPLRIGPTNHRTVYTKLLSPFNDVVDKTPIIRSVVLKLLLKYSFSDVKAYLQDYLVQVEQCQILDKDDKTELYALFVNCLEDSMYEKIGACTQEDQINCLREDGRFLERYLKRNSQETLRESSIEYLQGVARVRLCLDRVAELLLEMQRPKEWDKAVDKQQYLQKVTRFCRLAGNDWYRVYLVRKLTNQYGMEFAQKLSYESQFHWVFPVEIIQQQRDQPSQIDRYLVCGKNYRVLRDAVGKAMIECKMKGVAEAQKACNSSGSAQAVHLLLAIFRELTALYGCRNTNLHPKKEQCDAMNTFIQHSKALDSPALKQFAASLVTNSLPSLTVRPQHFSPSGALIEIVVHAAALLLCGQNRVLEPLRSLAFSPATMQRSFLPTMPEDLMVQAVNWEGMKQLRWYVCPNGHPCTIGECGRPMEHSRCVDCNALIGGSQHIPVHGFQGVQHFTDRTQTGHVLGDPRNREATVASEREMSPVVFIVIRLLTHLAMLLGATKDPQSLRGIIKPPVQDPAGFLQLHIEKDLEQLTKTLGKSADETINVVHLILCSLLKEPHQHPNQWPVRFDGALSTKEHRHEWERIVANTIIIPELKDLDKILTKLNRQISEDERICSNPVAKIVYGDPVTFLSQLPKDNTMHCSRMWSCRKRISVEYLGHVVQQKDGKDVVPILWKFLQKEAEMRLVKFLPDILALQRDLVKRFQNITDVEHRTIRDFVSKFHSDEMRNLWQIRVNTFLSVWNKLRRSLDTNGEIKLPTGYCDVDLTLDSEFENLLPRRRGPGLCSTALVSYLISLHNDLIYTVEKNTMETNSYSISPSEVADLHVISYEVERDLVPLILSNCQYSVEKGGETLQEFNLEKIQQQVTSRFLQGKPLITLVGIPTLVYRHDRNYEHLFNDVKSKLNQNSLPNSMINMISGELQSYNDICEALSVAEITLGFLAMAGEDPDMLLTHYVEVILQMGDQTSPHVLKALSRCHLKHIIALWQLLSTHKSEQLLRLKRDPFVDVDAAYKAELGSENTTLLNTFLIQAGLETFLQELHEMIILKLKHTKVGDELNPSWSLKDTLFSYIERKGSNVLTELEDMFPEEILLSHCIAAWKAAAALKRDRRLS